MGDLYEFAAATRDVPWHEAEACGWLNCAEAGGWLRLLPSSVLVIETPDEDDLEGDLADAILFGFEEGGSPWTRRAAARVLALLRDRAAVGKEKT